MGQNTSLEKNRVVCRKDLERLHGSNFTCLDFEECQNMTFLKVRGITRFWEEDDEMRAASLMADIISSSSMYNVTFAYAIIGNELGINVYLGTANPLLLGLKSSLEAMYPGADVIRQEENPLRTAPRSVGGFFTGIPTDKIGAEKDKKNLQIENILRGMSGKRFTYVVLARGLGTIAATLGHERVLEEMEAVHGMISRSITGGAQGNLVVEQQDYHSKAYFENLQLLEESLKAGTSRGLWNVSGYYAAENALEAKQLGNIIKASFSGNLSKPEPFRVTEYSGIADVIGSAGVMADINPEQDLHPLGRWSDPNLLQPVELYKYRFQTVLNSDQLGVLCQLPVKEFPGYYIDDYVEFDISSRNSEQVKEPVEIGDICLAGRAVPSQAVENRYKIEKDDLTRHALIIGITGGGKTNTSKSLLNTLWAAAKPSERVPFLVIESAKREYWELRNLKGFEDILVFTLGSESEGTSVKYRINPFETNPAISLQTHIDYLLATFKAAFDLYPPLPYILEKAVYEVYSDRGWDIVENKNRYGLREYPTLSDLYDKVDVVIDRMGYHQEVQSNVKAALQARIYSLMIGGKGAMLNTPKSVPIDELLSRPVVLELEDLGDDETKSFVIGILLVQLYEYRKSLMSKGSKKLSHILMVEEAHRLLKNVSAGGEGESTRAKSVEFFCNLLAEIRTFGQGIFIADQIPTKLASDTIKNTNLKIVHRTVAMEDRETIGRAMNMTPAQIEYLSSLRRGYAAVYSEGDNRPKCVKLPLVTAHYDKNRDEVLAEVREKVQDIARGYDSVVEHHAACGYCEKRCQYFDEVKSKLANSVKTEKIAEIWAGAKYDPRAIEDFLDSSLAAGLGLTDAFQSRCVVGFILEEDRELSDGQRKEVITSYLRYLHK